MGYGSVWCLVRVGARPSATMMVGVYVLFSEYLT